MTRNPESADVTVDRPPDFDEFWVQSQRLLDEVPAQSRLTHRPDLSTDAVEVHELHYTSFQDVRIAAWYTAPTGASGRLPAVAHIPGYISEPSILKSWSRRGYVAVGLAPRGKLRSDAAVNPGYPGLLTHHIIDRFAYGYRGFYLDVLRGLDVLAELPSVDPDRIGVFGSSQGGGLGIVAAALRPDLVKCVASGAPYLCGIMASTRLTHSYPYEEITEYLRIHPDHEPLVAETATYYDGLNFAPQVTSPALVHLGLRDDVCPPETGYAVYRRLAGPKQLRTYARSAHDAGRRLVEPEISEFIAGFLRPVEVR
jgi:cephalosporin-C deacetylase